MINANELRLGNWINYAGHPVQCSLSDLYICDSNDLHSGIHLTEEWLLRMGFVEDKIWKKCFRRGKFEVEFIDNDWRYELLNMVVILDWVHQLQNLHFATMREELEIKLDTMS